MITSVENLSAPLGKNRSPLLSHPPQRKLKSFPSFWEMFKISRPPVKRGAGTMQIRRGKLEHGCTNDVSTKLLNYI